MSSTFVRAFGSGGCRDQTIYLTPIHKLTRFEPWRRCIFLLLGWSTRELWWTAIVMEYCYRWAYPSPGLIIRRILYKEGVVYLFIELQAISQSHTPLIFQVTHQFMFRNKFLSIFNMKTTFAVLLVASASLASAIPFSTDLKTSPLHTRQACDNTATSRSCWGDYSIDTE